MCSEVAKSMPFWLSQFSFSKLRQSTGRNRKKNLIRPIFLYICVLDNLGPNIQYHINGVAPYSDFGAFFHKIFGFEGHWWKELYGPHYAQDAVTILPIVLHPQRFNLMQPYPGIIFPRDVFTKCFFV